MNTVSWTLPDGAPSLENVVEPLNAMSVREPLVTCAAQSRQVQSSAHGARTAVKTDALLPLAHASVPPAMAPAPLLVVSVKPDPLVAALYVASVCVDHVPVLSSPPLVDPLERSAVTVKDVGTLVGCAAQQCGTGAGGRGTHRGAARAGGGAAARGRRAARLGEVLDARGRARVRREARRVCARQSWSGR